MSRKDKKLSLFKANGDDQTIRSRLMRSVFVKQPSFDRLSPSIIVEEGHFKNHLQERLEVAWDRLSVSPHGNYLKQVFDADDINLGLIVEEQENRGDQFLVFNLVGCDQKGVIPHGAGFVSSPPIFFRQNGHDPFLSDTDYLAILANITTQAVAKASAHQYAEDLKGDLSVHLASHRLANMTRIYQFCQILHELENPYQTNSRLNEFLLLQMGEDPDRIFDFLNTKQFYTDPMVEPGPLSRGGQVKKDHYNTTPSFFDKLCWHRLMTDNDLVDVTDIYTMTLHSLRMANVDDRSEFLRPRQLFSNQTLIQTILGYHPDWVGGDIYQSNHRDIINRLPGFDCVAMASQFNSLCNGKSVQGGDYPVNTLPEILWKRPGGGAIHGCGQQIKENSITGLVNAVYNAYPSIDGGEILHIMEGFKQGRRDSCLHCDTLRSIENLSFVDDILPNLDYLLQSQNSDSDEVELSDYFTPAPIYPANLYPS